MSRDERLYVAMLLLAWWNLDYYREHYFMVQTDLMGKLGQTRSEELHLEARNIQDATEQGQL